MVEATLGAPALAGVHHLKLPVRDLARSREWYSSRLGYEVAMEFIEGGVLMGYALRHPNGGPPLGLRLDAERAEAAAGFDYFSIGVPDRRTMEALATRLSALGESHAGVHFASIGWILPMLHDPDGHEVRLYTIEQHTEVNDDGVTVVNDPRETADARALHEDGTS
jgi:catechol 2,3-dioxygenase-like lactoylglutathione lyase family enzyme